MFVMRTLFTAAALIFATSSFAEASTTFTLNFDDPSPLSIDLGDQNTGDTMATIESGDGACGPLSGSGSNFICFTGNGQADSDPNGSGRIFAIEGLTIPAKAQSLTVSFRIAGNSTHNGGRDPLEGSGRWFDFVRFNDSTGELFTVTGSDIEGLNLGNGWSPLLSQTFASSEFSTGSGFSLGVRVSGNGNEFIGLDDLSFTAAVPEPATWLVMIAGFGIVGFNLKRRRAATLAAMREV